MNRTHKATLLFLLTASMAGAAPSPSPSSSPTPTTAASFSKMKAVFEAAQSLQVASPVSTEQEAKVRKQLRLGKKWTCTITYPVKSKDGFQKPERGNLYRFLINAPDPSGSLPTHLKLWNQGDSYFGAYFVNSTAGLYSNLEETADGAVYQEHVRVTLQGELVAEMSISAAELSHRESYHIRTLPIAAIADPSRTVISYALCK